MNPLFEVLDRQGIAEVLMSSKKPIDAPGQPQRRNGAGQDSENPEWTKGLRQLYNSIVEEPLPDNFKDLLAQLDKRA